MTIESNDEADALKALWQETGFSTPPREVDVALVKKRSDDFARTIGRRNLREVVAAGLVVACFGAFAVLGSDWTMRAGSVLIALAAVHTTRTLVKEGGNLAPPLEGTTTALLAHERAQLDRQIALLSRVRSFYLAPYVPGIVLFTLPSILRAIRTGASHGIVVTVVVVVVVFFGIARMNDRAVAKLRAQRAMLVDE